MSNLVSFCIVFAKFLYLCIRLCIMSYYIRNKTELRCYANMFSTTKFDKLVESGDFSYMNSKVSKYGINSSKPIRTIRDYLMYAYNSLLNNYRNEYVYKNLIINKILLGKHSLNTTTILNEFKIGKSIADLVLLNGTSKVFEIKTELDSSFRCHSQISDYRKVFENIYLVTHITLVEKYITELEPYIGIIALTENKTLRIIRESTRHTENLDSETMIKCLRKGEYSNIIKRYFGELPKTTAVNFFSACKDLFAQIPVEALHDMMLVELKKRTIREKEKFKSDDTVPPELKLLLWNLDYDSNNYDKLTNRLNTSII